MEMDKRLLIVDDETPVLDLLTDLFNDEGYSVITASNAWMASINAMYVDCIILDLQLSPKFVMEGGAVLKRLWEDASSKIPVIVFSAFLGVPGMEEDLRQIERVWGKGRTICKCIPKSGGVKPLIAAVNTLFPRN